MAKLYGMTGIVAVSVACLLFFVWSLSRTTNFRLLQQKVNLKANPNAELPDPHALSSLGLSGSVQLVGSGGDENVKLSLNGSTLNIRINSTRSRCGMNETGPSEACVFRVYLTSDSFCSANFCSAIKFSNGSYQCNLRVLENHFNILLVLESFANSSDYGLLNSPGWGALMFNDTHASMGKALLEQKVQIGSERVLLPVTRHPKLCSYREANVDGNDFMWISKNIVEAAGLTGADALLLPGKKDGVLPLKQDYVWFPRGCHQPWVSQEELEAAGKASNGLDVVFFSNSRLRGAWQAILATYTSTPTVQFYHAYMKIWVPHEIIIFMARIIQEEPWPQLCPTNGSSQDNPRLLVIVVSEGIWAARGHEAFGPAPRLGIFRFYDNFLVILDAIRTKCRFRRVKIVLATQPQVHSWDCRVSSAHPFLPKESQVGTLGPRMQVANWAIRKVGREQGFLVADLGGPSDARRDATCDNRHYDDPDRQNVSLGVTSTFAQLMLAAVLEAIKS